MIGQAFVITTLTEGMKALILIISCILLIKGSLKSMTLYSMWMVVFHVLIFSLIFSHLIKDPGLLSLAYIATILIILMAILKYNFVQAILSCILSLNLLVASQIIISTFEYRYISDMSQFNDFVLTIPVYALQLCGLFLAKRFTLSNNRLLNLPWNKLSDNNKYTLILLTLFLYLGFSLNIYFGHIYREEAFYISALCPHLLIFFFQSIIITYVSLLIIRRTLIYENYQLIFSSQTSTYKFLLYNSERADIVRYFTLLDSHTRTIDIKDILDYIKGQTTKLDIKVNCSDNLKASSIGLEMYFKTLREILRSTYKFTSPSIIIDMNLKHCRFHSKIVIGLNDIDRIHFIRQFESNELLKRCVISSSDDTNIIINYEEEQLC